MQPEQVEQILDMVVKRQRVLTDPDSIFEALVSEAILHFVVGGPAVMTRQLGYTGKLTATSNVSLRVVSYHPKDPSGCSRGSFVLFEFPPLQASKLVVPPVVYLEGFVGRLSSERDVEVDVYARTADRLRYIALSEAESRAAGVTGPRTASK